MAEVAGPRTFCHNLDIFLPKSTDLCHQTGQEFITELYRKFECRLDFIYPCVSYEFTVNHEFMTIVLSNVQQYDARTAVTEKHHSGRLERVDVLTQPTRMDEGLTTTKVSLTRSCRAELSLSMHPVVMVAKGGDWKAPAIFADHVLSTLSKH